jgi:hypothetical protein
MYKRLVAVLVLFGSTAAAAQSSADFRSAGAAFNVPLPAGYCLPKGAQIDAARVVAAGDTRNVTHLTLMPCDLSAGALPGYILLKTPNESLSATYNLKAFLDSAGAAFESPEFKALVASGKINEESEASMSQALGTRVDLDGVIRPLGKDERCAYLGGTVRVRSGAADNRVSVGICMTVVAGRLLTINWFGPDKGSAGVAELLVKSKGLAGRIQGKPLS